MTANSTQRTERLTRNNALLLLVDHQVGLYTGVRDIDTLQLKHNIVGLTRAMLTLKVPIVVTTTTEKMWGPLIPELAEVLPGVQRIERTTVNAWDEKCVVNAVLCEADGRQSDRGRQQSRPHALPPRRGDRCHPCCRESSPRSQSSSVKRSRIVSSARGASAVSVTAQLGGDAALIWCQLTMSSSAEQ
jgi:hypothetical protein